MSVIAAILVLALTRAEMLERFRAPAVSRADGFVKVMAACPEDMRREYQHPVAGFASDVVASVYRGMGMKPRRFADPALLIYLGDERTNIASVVTRIVPRGNRPSLTRIYLTAPGYSDKERLRIEIAKALHRTLFGKEIDDAAAIASIRKGDPAARVTDEYADLASWRTGKAPSKDDEKYIKMMRSVLVPGRAMPMDVLIFASRLRLYPASYDDPFVGGRTELDFHEAIAAKDDLRVRIAALEKAPELSIFGGGRGEEMSETAKAFAIVLLELAQGEKSSEELERDLVGAEARLAKLYEAALKREKGS